MVDRAEQERLREQRVAENRRAAAPIVAELVASGLAIDDLDDIRTELTYKLAIPILLCWLPRIDNPDVKEGIVRTLSVRWAKPVAARPLLAEFRTAYDPTGGLRWAIGNGLRIVADDSLFEEIAELARDTHWGRARQMLAAALGNMRDPRAVDALIELLSDEEVAGHAVEALGKLKPARAKPYLEPFLRHPKTWVRNAAKRALAKIEKVEQQKG